MPVKYLIKSGRFKGLWHVRIYKGRGKYFHVGRFTTETKANQEMKKYEGTING